MAVMVTVLITVAVAVSSGRSHFGTVEDDCKILIFATLVAIFQLREHALVKQAGPYQEDGHIYALAYNLGISNYINRRTVYEDIIVAIPKRVNSLCKPHISNQFCWVWRDGTYRDVIHCLIFVALEDQRVEIIGPLRQIVAQTDMRLAEETRHGGVAEVTVYDENSLVLDSKDNGKVDSGETLTGTRVVGSYGYYLGITSGHELEVGPEHPEGLVDYVTVARFYNYRVSCLFFLTDYLVPQAKEPAMTFQRIRDFAQERSCQTFDIIPATNLVVEGLNQVYDSQRNQYA